MPTPPIPTKWTCWYRLKTRAPVIASDLGPLRDVQEDPHRRHRDQERRASGRHERERQPLRREEPHDNSQVDDGLVDQERRDSEREERAERIGDPESNPDAAPEEEAEEGDRHHCADEPELLAEDREDEVGV